MNAAKLLRRRARDLIEQGRSVLFPEQGAGTAWNGALEAARSVWRETFAPLRPEVADADVLEIGCEDGFLLATLLLDAGARSAVGIDHVGRRGKSGLDPRALEGVTDRMELHENMALLEALDPGSFDLILCRDIERAFAVHAVEDGLARLYGLLRPGGEALVVVGCAASGIQAADGPGYGLLTPSSWALVVLRSGFEIDTERRRTRDFAGSSANGLDWDDETSSDQLHYRLIRPWEGSEMDRIWTSNEQA